MFHRIGPHSNVLAVPRFLIGLLCIVASCAASAGGNTALSPLHLAVKEGDVAGIEQLIRQGGDPNEKDARGWTLLYRSVAKSPVVMETLLRMGADVSIGSDESNATPLLLACSVGTVEHVNLLLKYGANPNVKTAQGFTALQLALDAKRGADLLDVLIGGGADPNVAGYGHVYPLDVAIRNGEADNVAKLISHGAKPVQDGKTSSLGQAVLRGNLDITRMLIDAGANPNEKWGYRNSPLFFSTVDATRHEFLKLFLDHGADVHARDDGGDTALMYAARAGEIEAVRILLNAGSDPRAANNKGQTAYDEALRVGKKAVADFLDKLNSEKR